jgi:hypothetical protein
MKPGSINLMKASDGTRLLEFPEELVPYKNLIYVPLDLEIPKVDKEEFLNWFDETYAKVKESNYVDGVLLNQESSKRLGPSQNNKNIYPWENVSLFKHYKQHTLYYQSCLLKFPTIKNYIENLPFEALSTTNILKQEPGTNVGVHTDFDIWFGTRFYIINKSDARIFFQKAKYPTSIRITQYNNDEKRIPWDQLIHDEKIYARYPTPECSFHLTSTHAVHGVEAVPEDINCSRITFQFSGKLNPVKYAELLERSLEKYGDYAIWY